MLGYVTIEKSELRVREYDLYQAYYCGICKATGRRSGQLPRLALSYDSVFLALVLAALTEEREDVQQEHCIIHPIRKKPVVSGSAAIDYAADMMVILAYHKFLDDWRDEKSALGLSGKTALRGAYRKLRKKYPAVCRKTEEALMRLSELEKKESARLDEVCGAFADIMEALFTGFSPEDSVSRILGQMARQLGCWIYVIDALDDYEEDEKNGSYNPLRLRGNGLEGIEELLYNYLAEMVNAYDLLEIKKNRGIIENIIFMGLRLRTDAVLKERTIIHE